MSTIECGGQPCPEIIRGGDNKSVEYWADVFGCHPAYLRGVRYADPSLLHIVHRNGFSFIANESIPNTLNYLQEITVGDTSFISINEERYSPVSTDCIGEGGGEITTECKHVWEMWNGHIVTVADHWIEVDKRMQRHPGPQFRVNSTRYSNPQDTHPTTPVLQRLIGSLHQEKGLSCIDIGYNLHLQDKYVADVIHTLHLPKLPTAGRHTNPYVESVIVRQ